MSLPVLGIETSCDETAAAVYDGQLRSSVVASQLEAHRAFGGVVPEMASRMHIEAITTVVTAALADAGLTPAELAAVAVTHGPGLVGSLLVGVSAAKGLAFGSQRPLLGINHLEGHLYSNFIEPPEPTFPHLTLIASGGHSDLILVRGHRDYRVLGRARDDAAGEAFDKVGRLLGLPYPGGPVVDRLAEEGDPKAFDFPRARLDGRPEFSFSGLKTAVLRVCQELGETETQARLHDLCASFRAAVVEVLVEKTIAAAREHRVKHLAICGGVAANKGLRRSMTEAADDAGLMLSIPPFAYCTDNAAMIACAGYHRAARGESDGYGIDVSSGLPLPGTGEVAA